MQIRLNVKDTRLAVGSFMLATECKQYPRAKPPSSKPAPFLLYTNKMSSGQAGCSTVSGL